MASDKLQELPCKLLFAFFYEQGEFSMKSKVTWDFFPHTPSINQSCCLFSFHSTFILLRLICLLQNAQVSNLYLHSFSKCSVKSAFFTCMPQSGCTQCILRNGQLLMWFCIETKIVFTFSSCIITLFYIKVTVLFFGPS